MSSLSRLMTSAAAVGGLVLLFASSDLRAEPAGPPSCGRSVSPPFPPVPSRASSRMRTGLPVTGAVVSALGATTTFDGDRWKRPVRAAHPSARDLPRPRPLQRLHHLAGPDRRGPAEQPHVIVNRAAPRRPRRLANGAAVLAAGIGSPQPTSAEPPTTCRRSDGGDITGNDDHGETAWRLRHARRGILQDVQTSLTTSWRDDSPTPSTSISVRRRWRLRDRRRAWRRASLPDTPFSGQFNLLTTSSFDTPQQLFSGDNLASSVAYISVGAPAGSRADWAVRGAISQADISSWVVEGVYSTRGPARHHYDIGLSYATQRYGGGNPAGASRRDGGQPQRWRDLWVRHVHDHTSRRDDLRRAVRPL